MDPVTQGALGAALAQSAAKPGETRIAALVGGAAGLLADADVLIRSSSDPLLTLEYHRHFSHSLFFVPAGALVAALVLWPFLRSRLAFRRVYLFAFLGYGFSGVLDACTSYGTQLFWPLSDERVAWNLIAIVDPLFTLALLTAVVVAMVQRFPSAAWMGLAFASVYLLFGWVQQQRVETVIRDLAAERGHLIERLLVKPTMGNQVLKRTVYESDGIFHVDAVRVGLSSHRVYAGGSTPRILPGRDLGGIPRGSTAYLDATRFDRFSDGFTQRHPELSDTLGDVRYSMSPTGLIPLWGIEIDPERPDTHARHVVFRDFSAKQRKRFWNMLLGTEHE
jgi:inner membrane protein